MLEEVLRKEKPDIVLIQGDTTTTFVASLAAYYLKIRVGHVEAGLRTGDKFNPFPEEINRKLTDAISDLYFAPTQRAKENLLREGIQEEKIFVTGIPLLMPYSGLFVSNHQRIVKKNWRDSFQRNTVCAETIVG